MKNKRFYRIWLESIYVIYNKPLVFVPLIAFFLIISGISYAGKAISPSLQTTAANSVWLAVTFLALLSLGGYVSAGLIGVAAKNETNKRVLRDFFKFGNSFWYKNGAVFVFFLALFNLTVNGTLFLFTKAMIYLRPSLALSEGVFRLIGILIVFLLLIGVVIFFSFSHIFIVVRNASIVKGMKLSIRAVKKNYLATLSVFIILFVLYRIIDLIPGFFGSFVSYLLLFPYATVLFTRFVSKFGK